MMRLMALSSFLPLFLHNSCHQCFIICRCSGQNILVRNCGCGAMVASSKSRKKQAQCGKGAARKESQEALLQSVEAAAEQSTVKDDPSTSKPVRIYADGAA